MNPFLFDNGFADGSALKNLSAMQEMQQRQFDLQVGKTTREGYGNTLQYARQENPCREEPGRLQSKGRQSQALLGQLGTHTGMFDNIVLWLFHLNMYLIIIITVILRANPTIST